MELLEMLNKQHKDNKVTVLANEYVIFEHKLEKCIGRYRVFDFNGVELIIKATLDTPQEVMTVDNLRNKVQNLTLDGLPCKPSTPCAYDTGGSVGGGFIATATKSRVIQIEDSQAIAGYSTALGQNTTTNGKWSFATGQNTKANGNWSFATGTKSMAVGAGSFAVGGSWADGDYSVAMGWSTASGDYSTAMGYNTTAGASYSTALGNGSMAMGSNSVAMGLDCSATGIASFAAGNSWALGDYSVAMGSSIAKTNYSTAMGNDTIAEASYSTALGYKSQALGLGSFAAGYSYAYDDYSVAMGWSTASGDYSTAMGYNTTAGASYSTALGSKITVIKDKTLGNGGPIYGEELYSTKFDGSGIVGSTGGGTEVYADLLNLNILYSTTNKNYYTISGEDPSGRYFDTSMIQGNTTVNITQLVYTLVGRTKLHDSIIENLQTTIDNQQTTIQDLTSRLNTLEST